MKVLLLQYNLKGTLEEEGSSTQRVVKQMEVIVENIETPFTRPATVHAV